MTDFELTHFVPRRPESDAWLHVTYYTRNRDGRYHVGLDTSLTLTESDIEYMIENHAIEKLQNTAVMHENDSRAVWITPNFEIYLALEDNPVRDPNKKLLHQNERFVKK